MASCCRSCRSVCHCLGHIAWEPTWAAHTAASGGFICPGNVQNWAYSLHAAHHDVQREILVEDGVTMMMACQIWRHLSLSLSRQIFCSQAQNKPNYVLRLFECKELKEYPKLMEWLTYEGHAIMCIDPCTCCRFTIAAWRQLVYYIGSISKPSLSCSNMFAHPACIYGEPTSELMVG